VKTWAPAGETPLLPEALRYEHLSAISAITPAGKLYLMTKEKSLKAPDIIFFLRHIMNQIPGKLLIFWDRGMIHRAAETRDFLLENSDRIEVEWLPAYAPELNPDEGVWRYLKQVELRNLSCPDLPSLRREVTKAIKRLRRRPRIVQSFFAFATLIL
jgi:transposase